jgi:rhodanese-related sulfurtransferase
MMYQESEDMKFWFAAGAIALLAVIVTPIALRYQAAGSAQPRLTMTAGEAHAKASAGEIVLVDIRTPEEWAETGVPASAYAITLNQEPSALVAKLKAVMAGDPTRPLALICRTGNRSSRLQAELQKAGFTNVVDVGEGMAGSSHGQGWLKSGLPRRTGASIPAGPVPSLLNGAK